MSVSVRLLLPILDLESLELFGGLPVESLLCPGNLPALRGSRVFCLLAPSPVIDRFRSAQRFKALADHAEVQTIPIDDLVLDQAFDAVPAQAYMKGIAGAAPTGTAYVFLQPNLVFADGALGRVVERLDAGAAVLTATHLRADAGQLRQRLAEAGCEALAPRSLVRHALDCMDIRDATNVVNAEHSLTGPAGRLFWTHGDSTLLARDFMPSLVALRPSAPAGEARGFRDSAFAAALCPNAVTHHFEDSDRYLAVEMTEVISDAGVSVGHKSEKQTAAELSVWTTERLRATAQAHCAVFHAGEAPAGLSKVVAETGAHVKALVGLMRPPAVELDHPRWQLALYLWNVRRFELGRGPLPDSLFERLFAHAPPIAEIRQGAPQADRSGSAMKVLRVLRRRLLGHVPQVTFLHPNWLDFRAVTPVLRDAQRMQREQVLYISDSTALLARVLGAPALSSSHLLDGTYDVDRSGLRLVVLELSWPAMEHLSALIGKLLPHMAPGGRIVIFHRNDGTVTGPTLRRSLALETMRASSHQLQGVTVGIATTSAYQDWLRRGYEVALNLGRTRRPAGIIKGASLLALVGTLNVLSNLVSAAAGQDDSADAWASVTITINT